MLIGYEYAFFLFQMVFVEKVVKITWGTVAVGIFVINKIFRLRAGDEEQQEGIDYTECGMEAYSEFKRSI